MYHVSPLDAACGESHSANLAPKVRGWTYFEKVTAPRPGQIEALFLARLNFGGVLGEALMLKFGLKCEITVLGMCLGIYERS